MKNHIAEELPARKFAPAAAGAAAPNDKGNKKDKSAMTSKERVSQAASDIRYKANLKGIPYLQQYEQSMQNSDLSTQEKQMVKAKLLGKGGGGMRAENFNPIFKNAASDNVAKALFKVFVEKKEINIEDLKEFYSRLNSKGERIFHVRITDRKTGKSYTDDVTREKINRLRANPNILSVEMTEYRPPSESQRTSNTNTARVTAGIGLDPVGKEDGDVNNNGIENDKSDKYIMKKRGAIGNAIATRKEEFIHEAETEDSNTKKIDVMKKGKKNKVNTSPTQGENERVRIVAHNELEGELIAETGYSKFLKKVHSLPEKVKEEMECGSDDDKKKKIDPRQLKTIKSRMITTLGLMGIKASYEPEGEVIDEAEKRIRQPRQSANPRGTYDSTGIGQYPRTGKERKKMRKGEPVGKYSSLEREPKPMIDDENPPRRYRDDNPALTARDRNPNLR